MPGRYPRIPPETVESLFSGHWYLEVIARHGTDRIEPMLTKYLHLTEPPDSRKIYDLAKEKFRSAGDITEGRGGDVQFWYSGMDEPISLSIAKPPLIKLFMHSIEDSGRPTSVHLRLDSAERMFLPQPRQQLLFAEEGVGEIINPPKPSPALVRCLADCGIDSRTVKHIVPYQEPRGSLDHVTTAPDGINNGDRVRAALATMSKNIVGQGK